MEAILKAIWDVMNSPAGITVAAGVFLWLLNKAYSWKPAWAAFEGTIISGIKYAEKAIDDETDNKAMSKLDCALRYVLKVYEDAGREVTSEKTVDSIREGIQIVHDDLEERGTL